MSDDQRLSPRKAAGGYHMGSQKPVTRRRLQTADRESRNDDDLA
jgi:hypothetical protein